VLKNRNCKTTDVDGNSHYATRHAVFTLRNIEGRSRNHCWRRNSCALRCTLDLDVSAVTGCYGGCRFSMRFRLLRLGARSVEYDRKIALDSCEYDRKIAAPRTVAVVSTCSFYCPSLLSARHTAALHSRLSQRLAPVNFTPYPSCTP
jgi:hypothetical protein